MGANQSGAIAQLVAVLRKYFLPRGNPPQCLSGQVTWFTMPSSFSKIEREKSDGILELERRKLKDYYDVIDLDTVMRFKGLFTDNRDVQNAIEHIPELAETKQALSDALDACSKVERHAPRLKFLLNKLLGLKWAITSGTGSVYSLTSDQNHKLFIGYDFFPLDRKVIDDIDEAGREVAIPTPKERNPETEARRKAAYQLSLDETIAWADIQAEINHRFPKLTKWEARNGNSAEKAAKKYSNDYELPSPPARKRGPK